MERPPRRLLRLFVILVLGGIGIGACLAALVPGVEKIAGSSQYSGKVAPMLKRLDEPTLVYDKDGGYLDTLGLRDRRPVELSEVPKGLIHAVLATEDQTFYDNAGVDVQSMVRALVENVDKGGIEQGGSTITQQLIKNRVFGAKAKRDLDRKIKEAVLAKRLTDEWSKNHILEEYLNTVYFGEGSYGVEAAAERFFNTPLEKLDLAQTALLAGLIKNPEGDNPYDRGDRAIARRAIVLNQMAKQHYITKREALVASVQPIQLAPRPQAFRPDNYYVAQVRDLLTTDPRFGLGGTNSERESKLNTGGLRVYTAYDATTELMAQAAIDTNIPETQFKAALAAIDPSNGDVKAIVAGPHLDFTTTQINLATMPVDTGPDPQPTGRQPGSTFKAIVLATALENGFSVKDSIDGSSPCTLKIDGLKYDATRRTRNSGEGGGGVMSLRSASENSVNCAFFRLGAAVGLPKVVEMAKRLGVTHPINPANYSLSIGNSDGVSPLDMATVFATFAADGVRHDPVFIKKVTDSNGNVIFEDKGEGVRAIDPQIARTVTDVLQGVIKEGTGTRARLDHQVAAGKTGTTDEKSDAWFVGYTPQLVAAVWMGNPLKREGMNHVGRFSPVYGGTWPATVWKSFMSLALYGQPEVPFIPPDQKLWPYGRYVSENGRGKTSYSSNRSTQTTKPLPFFGFPPPQSTAPPAPPPTAPPATTPTTGGNPPGP